MQISPDENLIRDGLQFKRDLGSSSSSLYCFRQALIILREQYINKAKVAHSRKNEERAAYWMGVVEGIDLAFHHPDKMVRKWEQVANDQMFGAKVKNGA